MEIDPNKDYYIEPVEIEVYLKKAGKVRTVVKDLYIELIPEKPTGDISREIFGFFAKRDEPIDLLEVENNFPHLYNPIYSSYYHIHELYETCSKYFKQGMAGSAQSWRMALYLTELLLKYEPTAASKIIGNFNAYNLNYLIIRLNKLKEPFLLEDSTVAYLIKRRNIAYADKPRDKEFDKLIELWEHNVKEKFL